MDEKNRRILEHLRASGPSPASRVTISGVSTSALYRRLTALERLGHVTKDRGLYCLLPAGAEALELTSSRRDEEPPDLPIPHLDLMPTPEHRALLRLVAAAVVARRGRLRSAHHASFVLVGPALRWKTFFGEAACLMTGCDPTTQVLCVTSESGRSVVARRGARGERVSERQALAQPVVVLDEFNRGPPEVRRLVQVLLNGQVTVPFENDQLELSAVPILTTNPRPGQQSLAGQLDLDAAMLRRCVVLDLTNVEIPPTLLTEGDERLAKLRALGPADLPSPCEPTWDPRERVAEAVRACLRESDALSRVDAVLVAMLATAMTAWLEPEDALRVTLESYFTLIARLGWLHPDWRTRLSSLLDTTGSASAPSPDDPAVDLLGEPNPFDYDETLGRLAEICSRLDLSPRDAGERLRLLEPLTALGVGADQLKVFVDLLAEQDLDPVLAGSTLASLMRRHADATTALDDLERRRAAADAALTTTLEALHNGERRLESVRVPPDALPTLISLALHADSAGVPVDVLCASARAAVELGEALSADPTEALHHVRDLAHALMQEAAKSPPCSPSVLISALARAARSDVDVQAQVERTSRKQQECKAALEQTHRILTFRRQQLADLDRAIEERARAFRWR